MASLREQREMNELRMVINTENLGHRKSTSINEDGRQPSLNNTLAQQKKLPAITGTLIYLQNANNWKRKREENGEPDTINTRSPKKSKTDNTSNQLRPRKPIMQLRGSAASNPKWYPKGTAKGKPVPNTTSSSLKYTGKGSTETVTQTKKTEPLLPAKLPAPKIALPQNRPSRAGTSSKDNKNKNARSAVSKKTKLSGAASKNKIKGADTRPTFPKKFKGPGLLQQVQDDRKKRRKEEAILKATPPKPLPTRQEFSSLQQQFEGISDKAAAILSEKQAKLDRRTIAIANAKAKKEQDALAESEGVDGSMVEEPIHGPCSSSVNDELLALRRAQYHRKHFRGLETQHKGQCANSVLQCLANLPKVAKLYKDKDSDCVRSEQDLDDSELFGVEEDIIMEQETGALFRELIAPDPSAIDSALYDRKLANTGLFPEEILGGKKVDASQYLTAWIKRHDQEHRTLESTDSTKKTPLGRLLNGTLKIEITCRQCKESEEDRQDFTSPLQLQVPADAAEVSLEGCIDDFFKTRTVHNHECKHCKKLVDATRKTWFSQLPPNIIFSLNRTHDSGEKNSNRVRVNLGTVNLQEWCGPNLATQDTRRYELSSMIMHRGESVQNGRYAAACRVHGSGKEMADMDGEYHDDKWRIVEDETVSKNKATRMIRNFDGAAQLLFLQKLA